MLPIEVCGGNAPNAGMATPAPAEGSAPAPAQPPPAAPSAEQLRTDIPSFSAKQLDDLLVAEPPAEPAPTPAPATPEKPDDAPADPETPDKPDEQPQGEEHEDDDPQPKAIKIKPSDFKEQEVLRLMKPRDGKPGLTLQQAYAKVYGNETATPAKETTTEPEAPASPTAGIEKSIGEKQAQLEKVEADLKKAADDMDIAAVTKLTRDAARLERDIENLHAEAKATKQSAEQAAQNTFRQTQATYTQQAVEMFPTLRDVKSAERQEFDAFIKEKFEKDPEYGPIFDSPKWPLILAKEFAEVKGWTPAKASRTADAPAKPAAPSAPKFPAAPAARASAASVVEPGADGSGSKFTPTVEQLKKDVTKYSAKELDAMLAGGS